MRSTSETVHTVTSKGRAYPPRPAEPQVNGSRSTRDQSESMIRTAPGATDSVESFLKAIPAREEDPTRHVMFTELIRLKTRSIELQIAEAKRAEKEAEVELARLKAEGERRGLSFKDAPLPSPVPIPTNLDFDTFMAAAEHRPSMGGTGSTGTYPFITHARPPEDNSNALTMSFNSNLPSLDHTSIPMHVAPSQSPMTPFDVEAMMQDNNLDNLFSWLPDFGDATHAAAAAPGNIFGLSPSTCTATDSHYAADVGLAAALHDNVSKSHVKRAASVASSASASPPPAKRKRTIEKKAIIEQPHSCFTCSAALGRILVRAPRAQMPDSITVEVQCPVCQPLSHPSAVPEAGGGGSTIGTVEMRKRMRTGMEAEDEEQALATKRQFCDVCQRVIGAGRIADGDNRESIGQWAELICPPCDAKYQRCSDCGGGGGIRTGIGKWRMKQIFPTFRKTCSLSHNRMGNGPREIGVHITPMDFSAEQLKEVLGKCKALWKEKILARLAVPEMLEIDLPAGLANPLREYADVEDIVNRNWPTREAMIKAEGADPQRFKRLLSLIWAHSKPRRSARTVDIEEEYGNKADGDEQDMSTVLANVKRTNIVIPPGSELVGMWGAEWDMQQGSLLISTLIPFEGADGEDSTALSVGEMISKVQNLRVEINARELEAKAKGKKPSLLPQCEHLWVVSGGSMPLVRERVEDVLIKKRSFVHVDEYLTRHPDFIHALHARPVGLHPDLNRPLGRHNGNLEAPKPLVLVRWLGKDFDADKVLEIKQQEFGGKPKGKKRAKGKA